MPATDPARAAAPPDPLPDDAGALVAALAREPRPAGSEAERRARARCAAFLAAHGFQVREEAFEYSAFPGRWGTPVAGAASIGLLAIAGHLGSRGDGSAALGTLVVGGAALGGAMLWLARAGVLHAPLLRRPGVNLVAERGTASAGGPPRVWLVAHLDSKSQPVSIGLRAAGITGSAVAWLAALGLAVGQLAGAPVAGWWGWVSALGALAGAPVAASVVGDRSPGALDNASGVAAVLLTAGAIAREAPVGVLLTSAEELGLAGARAWAARAEPGTAINFDGLDDDGALTAMHTRGAPHGVLAPLRAAARALGVTIGARRLLPGILVDAVALADRGWQVVTLSRGTVGTLARIHRPADAADRITGTGVLAAARLAAAAVAALHLRGGEG